MTVEIYLTETQMQFSCDGASELTKHLEPIGINSLTELKKEYGTRRSQELFFSRIQSILNKPQFISTTKIVLKTKNKNIVRLFKDNFKNVEIEVI